MNICSTKWMGAFFALAAVWACAPARAELQEVAVGGEITLRARGFLNVYAPGRARRPIAPAAWFPWRALGTDGLSSAFAWDDRGPDSWYTEQVLRLNVNARLSQGVSAFLELYNYDIQGEDFPSDYLTGNDTANPGRNDLEFLQAYVEMDGLWGGMGRLRLGRQLMTLGKGWLIGAKSTSLQYCYLDAARLTLTPWDNVTADLWTANVGATRLLPADDRLFHGVHATWAASPALNLTAFYMLLHDGSPLEDTSGDPLMEARERLLGLDRYGATWLHTLGGRVFGEVGAWDYDLEGAGQWGDAAHLGARFRRVNSFGDYGDDGAEFATWAADAEVGRTFDARWSPRVFAGAAWYDGEDRRAVSFGEWLNPFARPRASVSFNRLYSQVDYDSILGGGTNMSNFWLGRAGVRVRPAEKWTAQLRVISYRAVGAFARPASLRVNGRWVPVAPSLSFWDQESSKDLCVTLGFSLRYDYSPDLSLTLAYSHLFTADGLGRDGNFVFDNGTGFAGGTASDDADYIGLLTEITF